MWDDDDEKSTPPPMSFNDFGEEEEMVRCKLIVRVTTKSGFETSYNKIVNTSPGAMFLETLGRGAYGKYVGDNAAGNLSVFVYSFTNVEEAESVEIYTEMVMGGWDT